MHTFINNQYIVASSNGNKIEITQTGSIPSEVFRASWNSIAAYTQAHKLKYWLIDQRAMSVYPQDYKWFLEEWGTAHANLFNAQACIALVSPKNFYCEFTQNQFLKTVFPNGNLNVVKFENTSDAQSWLKDASQTFEMSL